MNADQMSGSHLDGDSASCQHENASPKENFTSSKGAAMHSYDSETRDDEESSQAELNTLVQKRVDLARKGGKLELANVVHQTTALLVLFQLNDQTIFSEKCFVEQELSEVPAAAMDLREHVRVAWLHENTLKKLPPEISYWINLTQLRVSKNRNVSFPCFARAVIPTLILILLDADCWSYHLRLDNSKPCKCCLLTQTDYQHFL